MADLREAQVVRVNHSRRTVDLVYLDNAEPVREVRVAGSASSVSGSWDVPDMPLPATEQTAGAPLSAPRNMVALVGMVGRKPVVLAFTPQDGDQVRFNVGDLFVERHPSGVVSSIEPDGSIQHTHPGGATIRLGSPAITDLAALAADKNWVIPAGAAPPTLTIRLPGLTIVVDPAGDVTVTGLGNLTMTFPASILNGPLQVNGTINATETITSAIDVIAGTISGKLHHHTSESAGSATSGPLD